MRLFQGLRLVSLLLVSAFYITLAGAQSIPPAVYRVNCGGPAFQDQYGLTWAAGDSTYALGGENVLVSASNKSQLILAAGGEAYDKDRASSKYLPNGKTVGGLKAVSAPGPYSTMYETARVFDSRRDEAGAKLPGFSFKIAPERRYMLRLHFAAIDYNATGFNLTTTTFNVAVNGGIASHDYSPLQEAGGVGRTAVLDFLLPALNATSATILLIPHGIYSFVNGVELVDTVDRTAGAAGAYGANVTSSMLLQCTHRVNCGGSDITPNGDHLFRSWSADYGYTTPSGAVNTTHSINGTDTGPAWIPQALYQSQRVGVGASAPAFAYTLAALPNSQYFVRFHFAEIQPYAMGPGGTLNANRSFDSLLNYNPVLLGFNISSTAGGPYAGLVEDFFVNTSTLDAAIVLGFAASLGSASACGAACGPAISGIEVLRVVPFTLPPHKSFYIDSIPSVGNFTVPGDALPPLPPPSPEDLHIKAVLLKFRQALGNPKALASWQGSPCQSSNSWAGVGCAGPDVEALVLGNLNLTGPIIADLGQLTDLRYLWLNGNNLSGQILPELGSLTKLLSLRLHNNSLTGPVPGSLANLTHLHELTLDNNQLSGVVPLKLLTLPSLSDTGTTLAVARYRPGNDALCTTDQYAANEMFLSLCGGPPGPALPPPSRRHGAPTGLISIIAGVIGGAALLACCVMLGYCYGAYRRRRRYPQPDDSERGGMLWMGKTHPTNRWDNQDDMVNGNKKQRSALSYSAGRAFTLAELKKATEDFADGNVIGAGGFGKVYRGTLDSGLVVAVKRHIRGSGQGQVQFFMELEVLSKVRHRHLVSLIGYCHEKNEMILVYEFMPGGTLRDHICSPATATPLSWKKRLEIVLGAARGIEYLHHGLAPPIIHRDLKSTNILLDGALKAKVGDFGLSRNGPEGDVTHISTVVRGSFGYVDPEYYKWLKLTPKSDVYSFGVILLELLAGRKVIDFGYPADSVQVNLVEWSRPYLQRELGAKIADKRLRGAFNAASVDKIAGLVLQCAQEPGNLRPSMVEVIQVIESALALESGNFSASAAAAVTPQ